MGWYIIITAALCAITCIVTTYFNAKHAEKYYRSNMVHKIAVERIILDVHHEYIAKLIEQFPVLDTLHQTHQREALKRELHNVYAETVAFCERRQNAVMKQFYTQQ